MAKNSAAATNILGVIELLHTLVDLPRTADRALGMANKRDCAAKSRRETGHGNPLRALNAP